MDVFDVAPDSFQKETGKTFLTPMPYGLQKRAYSWLIYLWTMTKRWSYRKVFADHYATGRWKRNSCHFLKI